MNKPELPSISLDTTHHIGIIPDRDGNPRAISYGDELGWTYAFKKETPNPDIPQPSTSVFKGRIALAQFDDIDGGLMSAGIWVAERALKVPRSFYETHEKALEHVRSIKEAGDVAILIDISTETIKVIGKREGKMTVFEQKPLIQNEHESVYEAYWYGYVDVIPFPVGVFQYGDIALVGISLNEEDHDSLVGETFSRQAYLAPIFSAPKRYALEQAVRTVFPGV